jgi:tRNA pseudouridine38-40 synthase
LLPADVSVRGAAEAAPDFHAQYGARGKVYTYSYWPQRCRPALYRNRTCHVPGPFDLASMRQALPYFLGRRDFRAFMDSGSCERNPVRELQAIALDARNGEVVLTLQGDGFLYHMVRIIAGTLLLVAQGKIEPQAVAAIIDSRDRRQAGKTMPPQGLCLEQVLYEPPLFTD